MFSRRNLTVVISLILALGAIAFGQQPQAQAPEGGMRPDSVRHRDGRRHDKNDSVGRHGFGRFPGMRQLNLTEDQRQQQRAIVQRHLESTKAQREELFKLREKRIAGAFTADDEARAKALRQEIHNSMQGIHSEIEGILTAEQRTKLEQLKTERKARHEMMRERRQERRKERPQTNPQ